VNRAFFFLGMLNKYNELLKLYDIDIIRLNSNGEILLLISSLYQNKYSIEQKIVLLFWNSVE
jgi:hypothetical protein